MCVIVTIILIQADTKGVYFCFWMWECFDELFDELLQYKLYELAMVAC